MALPDGVTVKKEPGVKEEPKKKKRGRKKKVTRGPKKSQCPEAANGFGYQCEKCGKVFKSVQLMDMHREKEHNDNVTCQECGEVCCFTPSPQEVQHKFIFIYIYT